MRYLLLAAFLFIVTVEISAQVSEQVQRYRDDEYGSIDNRKESVTSGNLVRTLFYNNGEIGQWPFSPSGEWITGTGHNYIDGTTVLIAAEVETDGGIVHPLQISYREWMDRDPVNGTLWGFEPVGGYSNPQSEEIAQSTDPNSWPESWPAALNLDDSWDGLWYGYFGKGVMNADFESFFVMDDSQDKEWSRPPYNYFPISSDHNRGGLGLRVEVRNFAWREELFEDVLFWHYDIINLADNQYEKAFAGFFIDPGVGGSGDSGDDMMGFESELDLIYAFDYDGFGYPGSWETGYFGFALLETPSNSDNGIDDDGDGLVDESRNDGIDNDGDWTTYSDLNGNGNWDAHEPLNNDVGMDGIGPDSENYSSADQGEGDGIPTDGEPNFDATDIDESDMIGLTGITNYVLGDGGTGGGYPKDDETMWLKLQSQNFDTTLQNANINVTLGSGPYKFDVNGRVRISSAIIMGKNRNEILLKKILAQNIYNNNYKFDNPYGIKENSIKGELLTSNKNSRATGDFYLSIINQNEVVANDYRIDFVELTDHTDIGYSLFDLSNDIMLFSNKQFYNTTEEIIFNGMKLTIIDDFVETIIDSLTNWEIGNSNLNVIIKPKDNFLYYNNIKWQEDFKIKFMESNIYTTPFNGIECNIEITLLDSTQVDYEIDDRDHNGDFSFYDHIVLIKDLDGEYKYSWICGFYPPENPEIDPIYPSSGDIFNIKTTKKFKAGDQIFFSTDLLVGVNDSETKINNYSLEQNYPNPFNPTTTIKYQIPLNVKSETSKTKLIVYDILGREIATLVNRSQKAGNYEVQFDASKLTSGVYFYKLQSGGFVESKKMILIK